MALWTPYADDVALDLSKPAVKEERLTPEVVTTSANPEHVMFGYPYPQQSVPMPLLVPVDVVYPEYYVGYQYPQTAATTSTQMSPVSGGSTCSGYESATAPEHRVSPPHVTRAVPLSPPESPVPPRAYMEMEDELSDDPDFQAYERNALRVMAEKNGGALLANNPRMRRAVKSTNQDAADDSYRKQRERNNFAAKQSRDRRKMREIHLALKVSYLKNKVASLKAKLAAQVCGRCRQRCLC